MFLFELILSTLLVFTIIIFCRKNLLFISFLLFLILYNLLYFYLGYLYSEIGFDNLYSLNINHLNDVYDLSSSGSFFYSLILFLLVLVLVMSLDIKQVRQLRIHLDYNFVITKIGTIAFFIIILPSMVGFLFIYFSYASELSSRGFHLYHSDYDSFSKSTALKTMELALIPAAFIFFTQRNNVVIGRICGVFILVYCGLVIFSGLRGIAIGIAVTLAIIKFKRVTFKSSLLSLIFGISLVVIVQVSAASRVGHDIDTAMFTKLFYYFMEAQSNSAVNHIAVYLSDERSLKVAQNFYVTVFFPVYQIVESVLSGLGLLSRGDFPIIGVGAYNALVYNPSAYSQGLSMGTSFVAELHYGGVIYTVFVALIYALYFKIITLTQFSSMIMLICLCTAPDVLQFTRGNPSAIFAKPFVKLIIGLSLLLVCYKMGLIRIENRCSTIFEWNSTANKTNQTSS